MFLISLFLPYLEVKFTKITKAVMKIKSTTKRVAITMLELKVQRKGI